MTKLFYRLKILRGKYSNFNENWDEVFMHLKIVLNIIKRIIKWKFVLSIEHYNKQSTLDTLCTFAYRALHFYISKFPINA